MRRSLFDYFYPHTDVLVNKLGIRNRVELEHAADHAAYCRMFYLLEEPLPKAFDSGYLRHCHRSLFQDVYDWAGQYRECAMSRNQKYADPEEIGKALGKWETGFGPWMDFDSKADLADFITKAWADENRIHPFVDGNGRSQYCFFSAYARSVGYALQFPPQSLRQVRHARDLASMGDGNALYRYVSEALVLMEDGMEYRPVSRSLDERGDAPKIFQLNQDWSGLSPVERLMLEAEQMEQRDRGKSNDFGREE